MAKYRKKPVVVDAVQWFRVGDHPDVVACDRNIMPDIRMTSICERCRLYKVADGSYTHGWIKTLEGGHIVCPSDFVVTLKGDVYPCKHAVFDETYQKLPMCKECKDTALDSFGLCPKCAPSPTEADLAG